MFTKRVYQFVSLLVGLVMVAATAGPAFAKVDTTRYEDGQNVIVESTTTTSAPQNGNSAARLSNEEHHHFVSGVYGAAVNNPAIGSSPDLTHPIVYTAPATTNNGSGSQDNGAAGSALRDEN